MPDQKNVFYSDSMVASKTKTGAVEMRFNGTRLQVDTKTARKIASDIYDCAANADVDAAVFNFAHDEIAKDAGKAEKDAIAAGMVDQVRQHRIKLQGEV